MGQTVNAAGAESEWRAVLALQPEDPTALAATARLCKREGLPSDAAHYAELLRRVDPEMKKIRPNPLPIKSVAQALENLSL